MLFLKSHVVNIIHYFATFSSVLGTHIHIEITGQYYFVITIFTVHALVNGVGNVIVASILVSRIERPDYPGFVGFPGFAYKTFVLKSFQPIREYPDLDLETSQRFLLGI
ncbi:hypothetical protein CEXT_390501 [Caerostris extrusa]|uniref:Uncharacterized protein n=1 Tax=Caerostris extrusa TaxID=172846 RepID=A0AAV4V029_CAEEX|nr:hypothetical protein CEXT_390501 [Caerostris extrusa]